MNGRYGAPRAASLSKEITWRPGQNYTPNRPSPVEFSPSLLPWNRAAHRVQAAFSMGEDGELHGGEGIPRSACRATLFTSSSAAVVSVLVSTARVRARPHKHDRAGVRPSLDVYARCSARRRARGDAGGSPREAIQLGRRGEDADSTRHRVSPRRKAVVGTAPKPRSIPRSRAACRASRPNARRRLFPRTTSRVTGEDLPLRASPRQPRA
jgi:hypothetical protein